MLCIVVKHYVVGKLNLLREPIIAQLSTCNKDINFEGNT